MKTFCTVSFCIYFFLLSSGVVFRLYVRSTRNVSEIWTHKHCLDSKHIFTFSQSSGNRCFFGMETCISSLLMGMLLFISWALLPGWIWLDPKSCKCIFLRKIKIVINDLVTHSSSFKYFKDVCILKLEIEIRLWKSLFLGCWLDVKSGGAWSTILALVFVSSAKNKMWPTITWKIIKNYRYFWNILITFSLTNHYFIIFVMLLITSCLLGKIAKNLQAFLVTSRILRFFLCLSLCQTWYSTVC